MARRQGGRRRVEAGLSLRELAGMAGVSHSTLGRWEAGASAPSPDAAIRWAEAMGRLGFEV